MGRVMSKEEFKENMMAAAEDQELTVIEGKTSDTEDSKLPEESTIPTKEPTKRKPRRKASKKTAPEAAGQETLEINSKAIIKAMEKAAKQEEAIKAAAKLTATFAEYLTEEAKKRLGTAEKYAEYTEILEDMI